MKIALVGATGMVGGVMMEVIKERNFSFDQMYLVASDSSIGKKITFLNKTYILIGIEEALKKQLDIAIFSAGSDTSLHWAPKFAKNGTFVIDNSSAWRMDSSKKLIVPEINGDLLTIDDKIIANPNCSTVQMLMVLAPIHKEYGIKRVVVSTYQSITGTGMKALSQLENEYKGIKGEMAYKHPIHQNAIPQCDDFLPNGYTKEEMKLSNETHKILDDDSIGVTATAIRIPVVGGHSESVNVELNSDFELAAVRKLLNDTPGVVVQDNPDTNTYPMPIYAKDKNEVFIGRIRKDFSQQNTLNLWIVADNLRKGAATNTIQIAEYLIKEELV